MAPEGRHGMLARVPESRTTKDVDLVTTGRDLDEAQDALVEMAEQDLGDHVIFRLKRARPTGQGGNQPGVQARSLIFTSRARSLVKWQ
ncbi:hypothetical protein GCM10027079_24250 [Sediminivirga luteola]|uniref:Uncharacterized protein n=1 Tax=Sediminivirga luteola TaxID=1774748 RepID=A0A8J2XM36_9MICO|nr:hypothetical protein GCM10011333_33290 [Sediminivirga luteola]